MGTPIRYLCDSALEGRSKLFEAKFRDPRQIVYNSNNRRKWDQGMGNTAKMTMLQMEWETITGAKRPRRQ